jgi:hypothetical protein
VHYDSFARGADAQEPTDVTPVRLIANPEKLDGKLIRAFPCHHRFLISGTYVLETPGLKSVMILEIQLSGD